MNEGKQSRLKKQLLLKIEAVVELANVAEVFPALECSFGGRSIVPDVCVFKAIPVPDFATSLVLTAPEILGWLSQVG